MERTLAGLLFLIAGIAISLGAGAWWMQRIGFTPDSTRETAAAILSDADIRIQINTVVTGVTAPLLETGVGELGSYVETEVLSTRAGAAMMGPIMEQAHHRIIGNRDEPIVLSGEQMVEIVRHQAAIDAQPIPLPVARIGPLNTVRVALRWVIPIASGLGLIALVLGIVVRPERRDVRRGLAEFLLAMAASMLLFGYLLPVHLLTAVDNQTWTHAIPRLALRTLPVVVVSVLIFAVLGTALLLSEGLGGRRRQSSSPLSSTRYRTGESRGWS